MARELTEACVKEILGFGQSDVPEDINRMVGHAFKDPVGAMMACSDHTLHHVTTPDTGKLWMAGLIQGIATCVLALTPDELERIRAHNKQYVADRTTPPAGV